MNTLFSKFLWLNGVFHHFCSIFNRLCSFGNAKVGEAKVSEAKFGEAKVGEAKRRLTFFFFCFFCYTVSQAGKAKVHTNIFEKAKIGEQNNLIMGNKYGQTIIF